ncbi:SH3 domain-containing protein [Streptomyces brasiliensis]|uniref:SH3b domain-containing protein n=1 Tax=Streptomyces brasiliensis TaxID=1954 RepID=A0A917KTP8_9ACTN|nr:SH3 domain-containing protein [Streptomyces brasiliensis]GGJ26548.1 hypothetical protein GCM10010121_042170 [Streptomyces brasiliensis]
MIRRTLKSGLLATAAVLAFLPTAASAAEAGHCAPRPVPAAVAQYPSHLSAATHRAHHITRRAFYRRGLLTTGRVATHRVALNVRSGPGTGYRVVGHRHANRRLALACKTYGSPVYGNHTWYRLAHHKGYVSAHYVRVGAALRWC